MKLETHEIIIFDKSGSQALGTMGFPVVDDPDVYARFIQRSQIKAVIIHIHHLDKYDFNAFRQSKQLQGNSIHFIALEDIAGETDNGLVKSGLQRAIPVELILPKTYSAKQFAHAINFHIKKINISKQFDEQRKRSGNHARAFNPKTQPAKRSNAASSTTRNTLIGGGTLLFLLPMLYLLLPSPKPSDSIRSENTVTYSNTEASLDSVENRRAVDATSVVIVAGEKASSANTSRTNDVPQLASLDVQAKKLSKPPKKLSKDASSSIKTANKTQKKTASPPKKAIAKLKEPSVKSKKPVKPKVAAVVPKPEKKQVKPKAQAKVVQAKPVQNKLSVLEKPVTQKPAAVNATASQVAALGADTALKNAELTVKKLAPPKALKKTKKFDKRKVNSFKVMAYNYIQQGNYTCFSNDCAIMYVKRINEMSKTEGTVSNLINGLVYNILKDYQSSLAEKDVSRTEKLYTDLERVHQYLTSLNAGFEKKRSYQRIISKSLKSLEDLSNIQKMIGSQSASNSSAGHTIKDALYESTIKMTQLLRGMCNTCLGSQTNQNVAALSELASTAD